MNAYTGSKSKAVKTVAIFISVALLVHFSAVLFLTENGISRLYPFAVRVYAEEFIPSGNSYAVYYNARLAVSESRVIVFGIDKSIAQSYDVLGHFMRFAKQYSNICSLLLDINESAVNQVNKLISESDERRYEARLSVLNNRYGFNTDFSDFLGELRYINATMPPVKKFSVASSLDSNGNVSIENIYSKYAEFLSETQSQLKHTVMAVVDINLLDNAGFMADISEKFGDSALIIKTRYNDSYTERQTESVDSNASGSVSHISFPFSGDKTKTYFVCGERLKWFYDYADRILNFFDGRDNISYSGKITGENKGFFFVISNGTCVTDVSDVSNG